ncbi:MAG: hypothetical protein U5K56_18320 [Halioglobus sp.]|nr:hypothetical protein [Halioglobus sp.]
MYATNPVGIRTLVYDVTPTGPEFRDSTGEIDSSLSFRIAGNHLLGIEHQDDYIVAYKLLDAYSSQTISWPDPTEGEALDELYPIGQDKAFVDARNNSFWMSLDNGIWSLELSGIEKWSYLSDHISGGDGAVVVHTLDPAEQGGFELYRVHRVSDGAEVGKFNDWQSGYSRIVTNGEVVVQARRGSGFTAAERVIDIFEVPAAQPPGC